MVATLAALVLAAPVPNSLTPAESQSGWVLLFDGRTTRGWHTYREKGVRPGWKVADGVLSCEDPDQAGDLVTDRHFEWFELTLDVNIGPRQNSGILFRVRETAEASWQTGPEIQIYDHPVQEGVETTGFLYQLYRPPAGVDAVRPAGEWNQLRIRLAPDLCWTEVNGVRYYEYRYGSPDFWARVAASKFAKYPGFAAAERGSIGIQGDHGKVKFRNIKIKPIAERAPGIEFIPWRAR